MVVVLTAIKIVFLIVPILELVSVSVLVSISGCGSISC